MKIKLPRKLKKKIYGTLKSPRGFLGIDRAVSGGDLTVKIHVENGKII